MFNLPSMRRSPGLRGSIPSLILTSLLAGALPASGQQEKYCQTSRGNVGNGYHYESRRPGR
jgi:hypothetical protein